MIDHVMRSRDGIKIHVVELFDPLGIEYCTFWFYSVVEKARHLFITGREPSGTLSAKCGSPVGFPCGTHALFVRITYGVL
jgi:hypothetical protein